MRLVGLGVPLVMLAALVLGVSGRARAEVPEAVLGQTVSAVECRGRAGAVELGELDDALVGQPLDRDRLRAFMQRLVDSGRFSDVQIEVDTERRPLVLEVRVVTVLRLMRVDVRGNEALDDTYLRERVGVEIGDDVGQGDVEAIGARLREAYAERGYENCTLEVRLLDAGDGSHVVLVVDVVEGEPTRVRQVAFVGDEPPPQAAATRPVRALEGARFDSEELERAISRAEQRLREGGFLEADLGRPTITREAALVDVAIPLHLGPRYRVEIEGAAPLRPDDVIEALELAEAGLDAAGLETLAERARDFFLRHGFLDAQVEVELVRIRGARETVLAVDVERGPPVSVHALRFTGAEHFDGSYLRGQVEAFLDDELRGSGFGEPVDPEVLDRLVGGAQADAPRRAPAALHIPPAQRYYAPTYERAIEHLVSLYQADGFLDVRIEPPVLRRTGERGLAVSIAITEGPQAQFFDVIVEGSSVVSEREIDRALALDRGEPYSEAALARAVERVLELYRSRGHLYATVTQHVDFSQDRTRAAVRLTVNERFPVRVGRIRIEGARRTREALVRAMLDLEEGGEFTPARVRRTEERLLELGVFGSVVVAPADADVPEPEKDVVVTLTERMPQVLDFGAGVSTGQGVRGSFEYAYRNLFGRAMTFSIRAQVSGQFFFLDPVLEERFEALSLQDRLERRITISFALPILGGNPDWRTSFNVLNMRDNARTFGVDKSAFDITFTYRPTRRFAVTLSPTLERNNVGLLVPDQTYEEILAMTGDVSLRQLLRVPEGRSTLAALGSQLTFDRRDSPFSPTRGVYLSTALEWAHSIRTQQIELGGVDTRFFSHHFRLQATASTYVPIRERWTLALQGRFGRIIHLEDRSSTYPNRQFFLGGVDTMRAYRQDAMVPQDIIDKLATEGSIDPVALVQGGETFVLLRAELRFPVVGDLGGALFSEFGNLWADVANFEPWRLRPTAGFGIRLDTPVGPIALDYGFNLLYMQQERQAVSERIGAFNFSIGVY